jgi:hypothetical protein
MFALGTGTDQDTSTQGGERYPFTHDGWRKEWGRALPEAKIRDFPNP